ncbi:5-(carboxyamino)imidazole ribonucleotide synthase [Xenorhabdus bovienii]|uniref:5-(carboxyamino)imidazole ribonucleotide synthase n=1 Tax=Xenorhabdus bovienii TaxID=40576 RepID=UPI00237C9A48|nr:5-(carboxyamino)imidazole ribonucleotide synthase [Xenorhabdus bovienii]MDE1482255.1 5-(carboxyamino)imidazole ribonucleotide synthase [Xenorhabdus bovienii]MDE9443731.1 5-(carboxyamino)imidazole ribonucleotide synthase [Xenorhabdus bovienii]MDE9492657.1 5-(carboxyamino)imidazole ribonucleotide synthase [Xenorhabdus bovienii]MDE9501184.1 5-(carboxyamino)imidazole ribonucleotide synthase [Xenorhabdus bovienii]MDE9519656.1 5-(carboxyamino)imidazole ribonucleotide synthase [Xenorhabdus bovieni
MKPVCVLGSGQLGRMLRQAGEPLGIAVYPVGLDAEPESVPYQSSVITAEIERWPETALTRELAHHKAFINRDIFPLLADRLPQKQLMDSLGLATAPWRLLSDPSQWPQLFAELGDFIIVKRRTGGYDGRGQWRIRPGDEAELPAEIYGECIVEQGIPFSGEVSLVGARNAQGQSVFYTLTHNLHQEGILRTSVALPNAGNQLQQQAEKMLSAIMDHLNYIGVMAMECFIIGDNLLINELAPRVHNSGHWTQNGASISQFELHLRAILDLPMPQPEIIAPSVMVNLIGTELNPEWLGLPLVHLHWYEKEVRPVRKVGHLNLTHADKDALQTTLQALIPLLPAEYQSGLEWAKIKLN